MTIVDLRKGILDFPYIPYIIHAASTLHPLLMLVADLIYYGPRLLGGQARVACGQQSQSSVPYGCLQAFTLDFFPGEGYKR